MRLNDRTHQLVLETLYFHGFLVVAICKVSLKILKHYIKYNSEQAFIKYSTVRRI